jgi:prepilin-type N-terminal cleavage/methylation domain-containing protein
VNRRGFSYIEILLAVTISAIIFTAVFPLLFSSIEKNRDTRLKLVAYEAASNEIENLRARKISSLLAPSHNPFDIPEIPGSTGDVFIQKNLGDTKIASVLITVSWTLKGNPQKVELTSYLYGSTE